MDDRGDGWYCACDEGPWASAGYAADCRKCRRYLSPADYRDRKVYYVEAGVVTDEARAWPVAASGK